MQLSTGEPFGNTSPTGKVRKTHWMQGATSSNGVLSSDISNRRQQMRSTNAAKGSARERVAEQLDHEALARILAQQK